MDTSQFGNRPAEIYLKIRRANATLVISCPSILGNDNQVIVIDPLDGAIQNQNLSLKEAIITDLEVR